MQELVWEDLYRNQCLNMFLYKKGKAGATQNQKRHGGHAPFSLASSLATMVR